jgi:hypothetical protein
VEPDYRIYCLVHTICNYYEIFCICSSLKKLAEKGCWDVAEVRAKKETKLMEYLVTCIHIITIKFMDVVAVYTCPSHDGIWISRRLNSID